MSLEAKRTSPLKQELPAGLHPLVISDVKLYKRNGLIITQDENPGVIFTFENPDKQIHQEIFWIGGHNYTKFQKLMIAIGLDPAIQHDKKEVIGKHIWGAIKSTIIMRGTEQIREDKKLSDSLPFTIEQPNYTKDIIEYVQEDFNQPQAF